MVPEDPKLIEELDLEDEELEVIEKHIGSKCPFPLIHLGTSVVYFNMAADALIPRYINWFTTHEYVIGLPAEKKDKNAYSVRDLGYAKMACFPTGIKNIKKVKKGYYKLYKYKDGFAFKRYEQYDFKGLE